MVCDEYVIIANDSYMMEKAQGRGVRVIAPYQKNKFFYRCVRKFATKTHRTYDFLYNRELLTIKEDNIIIFDSLISKEFLDWIVNLYRDKRIVFYYWNIMKNSISKEDIPDEIECWSYSLNESEKYNMYHNEQFYYSDIILKGKGISTDVYFCGADKGRMKALLHIENTLKRQGINSKIRIIPTRWYQQYFKLKYEKAISYKRILEEISESKAILDYYMEQNAGFTLRIMEALFFNKKIITNKLMIKEMDFYFKENVFLIGEDNFLKIKSFLEAPYLPIPDKILKKYDFDNWLLRFNEKV